MIVDNEEEEEDFIDQQFITYCFIDLKKKNEAIIILNNIDNINMMYRISKKGNNVLMGKDYYSIHWKCADSHCISILHSKRYNRDIHADFDISIHTEHSNYCTVSKTLIIHALMRHEIMERSSVENAVHTEIYRDVKNEFALEYDQFIVELFPAQESLKSAQSRSNLVCLYDYIFITNII